MAYGELLPLQSETNLFFFGRRLYPYCSTPKTSRSSWVCEYRRRLRTFLTPHRD
jgi:hypothetical protein